MTTRKQQIFIQEYLKDFNASRAARAAGYSTKTAYSIGQELLKKPEVQQAVSEKLARTVMGPEETLERLAIIARGDIADLLDITPTSYSLRLMIEDEQGNKITNPATKLIKKIKQKTTTFLSKKEDGEDREVTDTEIELYSAQDALNTIAKHHGLLVDKTELSGPDGNAIPVEVFDRMLQKVYGNDGSKPA